MLEKSFINIVNRVSLKLLDADSESEIFRIVSEAVKEILPDSYFLVSKLQPDDMNFRFIESYGFDKFMTVIKKNIGRDPFTIDFPFKSMSEQQIKAFENRKITHFPNGIYELANGAMNKSMCKTLELLLGIGDVCAMSFYVRKKYFGGITILLPHKLIKSGIMNEYAEQSIEIISNQAATAIQKLRDESIIMQNAEMLKSYNEQLLLYNRTKDVFFSIIAHDLIGPIGATVGMMDLLLAEYSDFGDDERLEMIDHVDDSLNCTLKLLRNLLDWSRLQQGKIEINIERCNLWKIVEDGIRPYLQVAKQKGISIVNDMPKDLLVCVDSNYLETAIRNLISNAVKFTEKGGLVRVCAKQHDDSINLSISDSGVGMSSEKVSKLFQIDHYVSTPGTDQERGTGLGLVLCKDFLEKSNCRISVESELGKGTIFKILIPVATA